MNVLGQRRTWIAAGAVAVIIGASSIVFAAMADDKGPDLPISTPDARPSASATPSATASGPVCTAELVLTNVWPGGYQANVMVYALAPLEQWTVTVPLGTSTVNDSWNSDLAVGATGNAPASGLDYNAIVAAGEGAQLGFVADGKPPAEGDIACDGTATGPVEIQKLEEDPAPPTYESQSNVKSPTDDDWLHTDGNRIVDAQGRPVWMTGANWFGFNLRQRVFTGLSSQNLDDVMDQIGSRGINTIRVPISTQLLLEWRDGKDKVPNGINFAMNPQLEGKTTLEIFEIFLRECKDRGIKVVLDVHSAKADDAGHIYTVWYNGDISTEDFIDAWVWVAKRYKNDDTIIGYDLKNEPHGQATDNPRAVWDDSKSANNWRYVAERTGNAILKIHPKVLIFVEGIEATPRTGTSFASKDPGDYDSNWWGGNLRFAKHFPVNLRVKNQLVYSPHEYGPLVYNQPWFRTEFSAQSLRRDVWEPNWLYLHEDNTAPLMIGEWGGRLGQDTRQDTWMRALRDMIVEERIAHTFWCLNPDSGDTGGLFTDGWKSWDEKKYTMLKPALWQDSEGKFVSLDHATPLPGGITVTEYYEAGNTPPS